MSKEYEIVNLSATDKGLLKKIGERAIVVNVKLLPGADQADNDWIMESLCTVYSQYYARVREYSKQEDL